MRPGPPPAPVAAPNLPPSRCSHRSSSILPQELQGNFSSRSRGLPLGEPAERRVLEGQARAAEGCGGVGCAGASSRPTCLIYLQRLWRPPPLFHSAFPAPFPAASEAFSCPSPFIRWRGWGEQRGRFCGRAASPGLGVYVNIPIDKQATSLIFSFPLEKPRLPAVPAVWRMPKLRAQWPR